MKPSRIVLLLCATGCTGGPAPAPAPPRAATPAEAVCASGYRELRVLFDPLSTEIWDEKKTVEDLAGKAADIRGRCERLLTECSAASWKWDVEYMLAYVLFLTFDRRVQAGESAPHDLVEQMLALGTSARAGAPPGSRREAECLSLLGQLYRRRADFPVSTEAQGRDLEAMREVYLGLLKVRPDWPDRYTFHLDIADSLIWARDFKKARTHLEEVLRSDPDIPELPSLEEKLFDVLTGSGDLEGMEELVHRRLSEYPERLERKNLSRWERSIIETFIDIGEFWLGYIRLAMGDHGNARETFARHINRLNEKQAELRAKGQELPNVPRIYRDFRSRDLLDFIDENLGKQPVLDFDFGDLWATEERVTLAQARGKVVAAVFRNPGESRAAPFLKGIDDFARRERGRGLVALTAGYLSASPSPPEMLERMRKDLDRLKVAMPGGFDPHPMPDPKIFRAMNAVVGTPSFVAFDRAGRIAWYLNDPRGIDVAVAERVLTRLLDEPPP